MRRPADPKVRVRIPEGIVAVKPMPKAGWTLETAKGAYVKAYQVNGEAVSEGVTDIVWTGSLDDALLRRIRVPGPLHRCLSARRDGLFPRGAGMRTVSRRNGPRCRPRARIRTA